MANYWDTLDLSQPNPINSAIRPLQTQNKPPTAAPSSGFLDTLWSNPGALFPPGSLPRAAADFLSNTYLIGQSPAELAAAKEKAAADTAARATIDQNTKAIMDALQPKPFSMNIPGGTPMPTPGMPALPDLSAARGALEQSQPGEIPRASEGEQLAGVLGSAATAAGKVAPERGSVGRILALAGGGAATTKADYGAQERKITDTENERMREFNRQMAQFEVTAAQTKYQAQWQQTSLAYQTALHQWEASQPKIQTTENGVVALTRKADGTSAIEFMPWPQGMNINNAGTTARKDAGGIGGASFLADYRARLKAAGPGTLAQSMAAASGTFNFMRRSNSFIIPSGSTDQMKLANEHNKGVFGPLYNEKTLPDLLRQAQTIVSTTYPTLTGKEYEAQLTNTLDSIGGAWLLQNPTVFANWQSLMFRRNQ